MCGARSEPDKRRALYGEKPVDLPAGKKFDDEMLSC
jgi:hypothetical protein